MQENTEEISSINERIFKILEYYNVTRYKFSKESGVSETTMLNLYKGKNKPSFDFIELILNKYEAISAEWLVRGIGEMLKSTIYNTSTLAASPSVIYEREDKYTRQLEAENKRLIAENERKQEIIDSFMSGSIVVEKKEAG